MRGEPTVVTRGPTYSFTTKTVNDKESLAPGLGNGLL